MRVSVCVVMTLVVLWYGCFMVHGDPSVGFDWNGANGKPCDNILYIGDNGNGTIQGFNGETGHWIGSVPFNSNLSGVRGLLILKDQHNKQVLLATSQNPSPPAPPTTNGEIDQYVVSSQQWVAPLVNKNDPNAPFAPRGIVVKDGILYVADNGNLDGIILGRVATYSVRDGKFLGNLNVAGFPFEFNPRALVFDQLGRLYVSSRNIGLAGGHILRFTFDRRGHTQVEDLVDSNHCNNCDLNRPEGIVISPDKNHIYVTSFRQDPFNTTQTDKILIFTINGHYERKIDLDMPNTTTGRAYAQAILFGPHDDLFVPITGDGIYTGEVRRYNPITGHYSVFIPPSSSPKSHLTLPWYLTFTKTDPATLAYKP